MTYNLLVLRCARRMVMLLLALCLVTLAVPLSTLSTANAQSVQSNTSQQTAAQRTTPGRARLVLLIVVDQFRYDYLERFGDLFVEGGLRRLLRDGASWTESYYDHVPTETAPGHATMMTGTWPAENGIIGNGWFDRETSKTVTSVSDETRTLFGGAANEQASSPSRLLGSTLGDELKLATAGGSKTIGISVKDRSAILPVGRHASAAYWFSQQTGNMVSSSYYFKELPAWVKRFNDARPADKFFGKRWERLLPEAEYVRRAGVDDAAWERAASAKGKDAGKNSHTFPYVITGGAEAPNKEFYNALDVSPFSNDVLLEFAESAITNEQLGADEATDLLSISFSANDYVGHRYGPYSHEAMDITLQVDRQIARLLDSVDKQIGLRHTAIVFTADHGVAPVPEHALSLNLSGGRIPRADVQTLIRQALTARYHQDKSKPDETAKYVQAFSGSNIYFNRELLKRDRIDPREIERIVGEAAINAPGIVRYFTRTQLESGSIPAADPLARRVLHGFYPQRSGDVMLIHEPFKYLTDSAIGATHGSPFSYDTHVPLVIVHPALVPGRYAESATPADIAPTLAHLLRIETPSNSTGRVLREALKPVASGPAFSTK